MLSESVVLRNIMTLLFLLNLEENCSQIIKQILPPRQILSGSQVEASFHFPGEQLVDMLTSVPSRVD